jgi:hypothetical protein
MPILGNAVDDAVCGLLGTSTIVELACSWNGLCPAGEESLRLENARGFLPPLITVLPRRPLLGNWVAAFGRSQKLGFRGGFEPPGLGKLIEKW